LSQAERAEHPARGLGNAAADYQYHVRLPAVRGQIDRLPVVVDESERNLFTADLSICRGVVLELVRQFDTTGTVARRVLRHLWRATTASDGGENEARQEDSCGARMPVRHGRSPTSGG